MVNGGSGNDTIDGGAGDDTLNGGSDDDVITGGAGDDIIAGGSGTDIAVYAGNWKDYTVSFNSGTGAYTIVDKATGDTDTVTQVEQFRFANGTFAASQIVNDAPTVASPIAAQSVDEDTAFSLNTSTAFADADAALGDIFSFAATLADGSPLPSWLSFNATTGQLSGTPANGDVGAVTVKVTATDANGLSVSNQFGLTVVNVNDPATFSGTDTQALIETNDIQTTGGTLVVNDVDSATTIVPQTNVAGSNGYGTFSINSAGVWSYTMNSAHDEFAAGTTYTDSLTVTTADGTTHVVSVNIAGTNDAPVATPVTLAAVAEDSGPRVIMASELLAGATDAEGSPLSITSLTVAQGTVIDNGNGSWTYTPAPNDDTSATFTYTVSDGTLTSSSTATLDITPENDPATFSGADSASLTETDAVQTTGGTLVVSDIDSAATIVPQTNVAGSSGYGTFSIDSAGVWTYTLTSAHDEFTAGTTYTDTLTVTTADGTPHVLSVDITGTNDAPVAPPVTLAAIAEDSGARVITAAELLAGATDAEGSPLSIASLTIASGAGTLVDNGSGTWTYTPAANDDTSVTFEYEVSDGTATTTSTAILDITPVNDPPVLSTVVLSAIAEDSGPRTITASELLAGVNDVDGPNVTITSLSILAGSGSLVDNLDGTWTYIPAANDDTSVTFTYTASDGTVTDQATATLDITPVNDSPSVAAPLTSTTIEGNAAYTLDLLAGAVDIDAGETATLTISDVTYTLDGGPASSTAPGGVSLSGSTLTLNPADPAFDPFNTGENHVLVISYNVVDVHGAVTTQTETITIAGANEVIIASPSGGALSGTLYSDDITGSANDDFISALAGNDTIHAGDGNDVIDGGAGADTMYGGDGDDIYFVDNAADVVVEVDTGEETNHGGIDQIRTSLASYTLGENSFVENLAGTLSTGQTLNGNTQANVITAGAGDDTVNAGAGDDTVFGGTGNDTLNGNGGRDTINAGAGNDIVNGGNGDDTLFGNGGQDILVGGAGIDIIDGGNGNDTLDGNGGADTLLGGAGNDILRGGNGADILTGGADADTFVFDLATFGKDVVTDFTAGTDKLQFATSVFADYDTVMANSVQVGSDVVITLDAADTITLRNITVSSLHSSDMIFV